jgi:2-polyprenyl-6-methoxyphenol hydroxylase-like FAD-dependent oxidoreductase
VTKRVLISRAGIAGCCLAWWLDQSGYAVTLVEQAEEPRRGGYVIDFWGLGFDVAERMGPLDTLRQGDLDIQDFLVVDGRGRRVTGINQGALQQLTEGRLMSLQRSAVALALYDAVSGRIACRFNDSVHNLEETSNGVDVTLRSGLADRYDLVFGADGLHSAVRQVAFGDQKRFERYLGYYVAAFTAPAYPHRDPHSYVTYARPGRQIWRVTLNEDACVFLLLVAEPDPKAFQAHDAPSQKKILNQLFVDTGWEAAEVLGALDRATDLYFDRVSQINLPHWTKGRIALLGDACACPSLLAGEGSSMAMAEAYTLAGELRAANGDHVRAFQTYEQRLRPYVERKQKGARGFAGSFVPKTALGLWLRNLTLDATTRLHLTRLVFGAQLSDPLRLANYGPMSSSSDLRIH